MKLWLKGILTTLTVFVTIACISWRYANKLQATVTITFHNKVGEKDLVLEEETYKNTFGEPFTVNRFRYYISNIILTDDRGKQTKIEEYYHLVDEIDSASKVINLKGDFGKIRTIKFLIGVDSIKNVSGVQTGELDPLKGMFWTWNTGYIFAKLEGFSDSSNASAKYYSYHVGGYKNSENALRYVTLQIPTSVKNNNININADILQYFNAVHAIKIANNPICHAPGELATKIADNYAKMFNVR